MHKWLALSVVANFLEVFLAPEGHTNPVGINYLNYLGKIQIPPYHPSMARCSPGAATS